MPSTWEIVKLMREHREASFLPGLGQDVFCAWCGGLMPSMSLQPHMKREHAAIVRANREWEWSNPL